jgi:hypothetical protein
MRNGPITELIEIIEPRDYSQTRCISLGMVASLQGVLLPPRFCCLAAASIALLVLCCGDTPAVFFVENDAMAILASSSVLARVTGSGLAD